MQSGCEARSTRFYEQSCEKFQVLQPWLSTEKSETSWAPARPLSSALATPTAYRQHTTGSTVHSMRSEEAWAWRCPSHDESSRLTAVNCGHRALQRNLTRARRQPPR